MGGSMSSVIIAGDTSGTLTLAAPTVAGSTTINVTAQSGTLNVAGPAFSAYCSSGTSYTAGVWAKQDLQTEEFDTNSNFASSRFTPTIAGYYQVNGAFGLTTAPINLFVAIYKNGSNYKQGNLITAASGVGAIAVVSSIVYLNGSTDYIEMWGYAGSNATSSTGANTVYFNGCFLRGV